MDDTLQMVIKHFLPDIFSTKILVQKLCEAMTKAILVRTAEGKEFIYRGKVPNIEFKVFFENIYFHNTKTSKCRIKKIKIFFGIF